MLFYKEFFQRENFYKFLFFILVFFFSKEWIVVNEEFIVAISFLVLFFFILNFSSILVANELDNRNNELVNSYKSLLELKLFNQKKLLNLYIKKNRLFKALRRITNKVEDVVYLITLRKKLITRESIVKYVKSLLVSFLIRHNFKLKTIYNNYLALINNTIKL